MSRNYRIGKRRRVAQEAAQLLYTEQEKEFRQAKLRAAKNLGIHVLPTNAEIAIELDRIAEAREGRTRQERLVQMRCEALQIMQVLQGFSPVLVGSVWRGTAHRNSDIDIMTYAEDPPKVTLILQKNGYAITNAEAQIVTEKGKKRHTFHIYASLTSNNQAEIVVHSPEYISQPATCEIYRDVATGLTTQQLQRILRRNPQQKFVPR